LRAKFCRHFDMEPVAGLGTDEVDQFVGIAQFASAAIAARQIAAQRYQALDAVRLVLLQDRADRLARAADARQVRRSGVSFAHDIEHGVERAVLGRAAGAEGDGEILGMELCQFLAGDTQLVRALGSFRRKEFNAEIMSFHLCSEVR
jgi:hypothetical protein